MSAEVIPFGNIPVSSGHSVIMSRFVTWYLMIIMIPVGLVYVGIASSLGLGIALVTGFALLVFRWRRDDPVDIQSACSLAIFLSIAILVHFIIACQLVETNVSRAIASVPILTAMVVIGANFSNHWQRIPDHSLHKGVWRIFSLLAVCAVISLTGWGPPTLAPEPWRRPVFPFNEPSLFALALAPILLYVCVTLGSRQRMLMLAAGMAVSVLVHSLTLVVIITLVACITLTLPRLLIISAVAAATMMSVDVTYYLDRVSILSESDNLSKLVYLQGWQMVQESWEASNGWGTGFQQLGVNGTNVPAADAIRSLREGEDMNLLDGGFFLAKFLSDFGVIGVVMALVFSWVAVRSAIILRGLALHNRSVRPVEILAHCIIVTFLVELYVRSVGYLTGSVMLVIIAIWILHSRKHQGL